MSFAFVVLFLQIEFGPQALAGSVRLSQDVAERKSTPVLATNVAPSDTRTEGSATKAATTLAAPASEKSTDLTLRPALRPKPEPTNRPVELRAAREKHLWYALIGVQHTAATFDAWSTRDAIESGKGQELNPLLRPFSHSNAIYGAIQVVPTLFDYAGYRMMGSRHRWMRRVWWLPQAGSAALYFWAGAHNLRASR